MGSSVGWVMTEGKYPASLTKKKTPSSMNSAINPGDISSFHLSRIDFLFFDFAEVGGLIEIGIACIEPGWVHCSIQCYWDMHFARPPLTTTAFESFKFNPLKQWPWSLRQLIINVQGHSRLRRHKACLSLKRSRFVLRCIIIISCGSI